MNKPKIDLTIEQLLERTVEVGDCLEWRGWLENNIPMVKVTYKRMAVRQVIARLMGKPMPRNCVATNTCENPLCVNPDHILIRTKAQHMAFIKKKIDYNAPSRIAKLQKARPRKLSDEGLAAARACVESSKNVAEKYGVSRSLVLRIRNGQRHRIVNASANPFAGLM